MSLFLSVAIVLVELQIVFGQTEAIFSNDTEIWNASHINGDLTSIKCSKYTCTIICNYRMGCADVMIDGSRSERLNLLCDGLDTCSSMKITSGARISTVINCTESNSCSTLQVNVSNSSSVDLRCESSSNVYACKYITLNAITSNNIYINCKHYGCDSVIIHAEQISNSLLLNCLDETACNNLAIYCGDSKWKNDSIIGGVVCSDGIIGMHSNDKVEHGLTKKNEEIIIGVVVGVGLIIFAIICWYCWKQRDINDYIASKSVIKRYNKVDAVQHVEMERCEQKEIASPNAMNTRNTGTTLQDIGEEDEGFIEKEDDKRLEVEQWFIDNVELHEQDVRKYCDLFIENGYDVIASFRYIDRNELNMIGIIKRGHQQILLHAINKDISQSDV